MKTITGRLENGTTDPRPRIECLIPEENHTGMGIIIFPGGGYSILAEHEGRGYAEYFVKKGIACFVVTYCLAPLHRHPEMLEDALAAIETIRANASDYNVDPNKIGVMGSSAGGHLAAHALTAWNQYESDIPLRPNFGILCYPVILAEGKYAHHYTIQNIIGENPSVEMLNSVSCEKNVTANTPPCFIWHTCEDTAVPMENSMEFASELRKHEVPFELHLYTKGRHGIGLESSFRWETDCLRWLMETVSCHPE
jgi:acetyl esterase/lipase